MPAEKKRGAATRRHPDLVNYDLDAHTLIELQADIKRAGGQRNFARKTGIPRTTLQFRLKKLRDDPFKHQPAPAPRVLDRKPGVCRFILTSAQDGTKVHEAFLTNLEAYRDWLSRDGSSCEIMVSGYTYSKRLFEDHASGHAYYEKRIQPYLVNERIRICDGLDFCAEMNTLPTAKTPLTGFHSYTRKRWGVFPHPKVQLVSVPTLKHEASKVIMTTGSVTLPNYVQKRAGIEASFHHVIGAVLVETDGTDFFCRHLLAGDERGDFQDLDIAVKDGRVLDGQHVRALTPGDLHIFQIDPQVCGSLFGIRPLDKGAAAGSRMWETTGDAALLDELHPAHLVLHDVLDFRVRNHPSRHDPHDRFKLYLAGTESVEAELREVSFVVDFLQSTRPYTKVVVVESNHDLALQRWAKEADHREDPPNAIFLLKAQLAIYEAMQRDEKRFSIFEHIATNAFEWKCDGVTFLREDDSFKIGDVECGSHGHLGSNGARGSTQGYAKAASKTTIGHQHTPAILDGAYVAGTTSKLDLGYNRGASSWSHSCVVQYPNGKRAIITLRNGRWRL